MINNYPISPIQDIGGLITTERSGLGKYGEQSKNGMIEFCHRALRLLGNDFRCAEIGCYAGEMTTALGMVAGKVHAIDPWENGYDPDDLSSELIPMDKVEKSFDYRVRGFSNIIKYKTTGEKAASKSSNEFYDLVYIDSVHKIGPCREEIKRWIPKVSKGGYIAGHDFCGYWGEVVDAVLGSVGVPDHVFRDGSWYKRINIC